MRKIFITIFTALFLYMNNAEAQLTVSVSSVEVDQNAQATVNVAVNGFTSLVGVQFSLNYDSLLLDFVSAGNFAATLPNLSSLAVSGPNGVGVKKGQITFSWFDSQGPGQTLPNGGRLFSIVFATKGAKGSKADITVTSTPRKAEFYGLDLVEKPVAGVKGTITI
ncbi:MAG: cohesin domain-containing protein, partial [Saprospiraceae bacterium]